MAIDNMHKTVVKTGVQLHRYARGQTHRHTCKQTCSSQHFILSYQGLSNETLVVPGMSKNHTMQMVHISARECQQIKSTRWSQVTPDAAADFQTWDSLTKFEAGDAADTSVVWSLRRDFRDDERGRSLWLLSGLDESFLFLSALFASAAVKAI